MKKIIYLAISSFLILGSSCKKDDKPAKTTYPTGQGVITGSGGASFSVNNTAAVFQKIGDTVYLTGKISQVANSAKTFSLVMVAKSTGNLSFNNLFANPSGNYTSGAISTYVYETTDAGGTVTAHGYFVKSGSVNISAISGSQVEGSYTAAFGEVNNGDPDINITGNFTGSF